MWICIKNFSTEKIFFRLRLQFDVKFGQISIFFRRDYFPIFSDFVFSLSFRYFLPSWFLHENHDLYMYIFPSKVFSLKSLISFFYIYSLRIYSHSFLFFSRIQFGFFFFFLSNEQFVVVADMHIFIGITFSVYVVFIVILHFAKWVDGTFLCNSPNGNATQKFTFGETEHAYDSNDDDDDCKPFV